MFIKFTNRPPHFFQNNTFYFFTSRTVSRIKFFDTKHKKKILITIINEALRKFNVTCCAWVVLDNHYHLLVLFKDSQLIPNFFRYIHGKSTIILNKLEDKHGRKIWWNYWDHYIRNVADFWRHYNYIHHNPVKHGYVGSQVDVKSYQFCSYQQWMRRKGQEFIDECFRSFPIKDFSVSGDKI